MNTAIVASGWVAGGVNTSNVTGFGIYWIKVSYNFNITPLMSFKIAAGQEAAQSISSRVTKERRRM